MAASAWAVVCCTDCRVSSRSKAVSCNVAATVICRCLLADGLGLLRLTGFTTTRDICVATGILTRDVGETDRDRNDGDTGRDDAAAGVGMGFT